MIFAGFRKGNAWLIPAETQKPMDKRFSKKVKAESKNGSSIMVVNRGPWAILSILQSISKKVQSVPNGLILLFFYNITI